MCMLCNSTEAKKVELVHTNKINLVRVITSYVHGCSKLFKRIA